MDQCPHSQHQSFLFFTIARNVSALRSPGQYIVYATAAEYSKQTIMHESNSIVQQHNSGLQLPRTEAQIALPSAWRHGGQIVRAHRSSGGLWWTMDIKVLHDDGGEEAHVDVSEILLQTTPQAVQSGESGSTDSWAAATTDREWDESSFHLRRFCQPSFGFEFFRGLSVMFEQVAED